MFLFSKLILDITAIVFHLPSIYINWGTDPKKELKDPQILEFWSENEDLRSKFSGSDNGSEFRSLFPSSTPFQSLISKVRSKCWNNCLAQPFRLLLTMSSVPKTLELSLMTCTGVESTLSPMHLRNSRTLPYLSNVWGWEFWSAERPDPFTGSDWWNGTINKFWNWTDIGINSNLKGSYPSLIIGFICFHIPFYPFIISCRSMS